MEGGGGGIEHKCCGITIRVIVWLRVVYALMRVTHKERERESNESD